MLRNRGKKVTGYQMPVAGANNRQEDVCFRLQVSSFREMPNHETWNPVTGDW
jgi:hypothetical protein